MNCPPKRWEVLSSIGLMAPVAILLYANSACAIPAHFSNSDTVETIAAKQAFQDLSPAPHPVANNLQATTIPIHHVEVVGSTILDTADFKPITQPLEHQPINLTALKQAADAVTQLYRKRGFATSRAIVPPQAPNSGVVKLQIIEGWLGEIQVKGTRQLQPSYIQSRLRLAAGSPLNLERLEAQIRLLNTDPIAGAS